MILKAKKRNIPRWLKSKWFLFVIALLVAGAVTAGISIFAASYDISQGCASTTLREGASGACVKQAQYSLNYVCKWRTSSGQKDLVIDGVFGPTMKNRVRQFQQAVTDATKKTTNNTGIQTDGVIGSATWNNIAHYRYNSTHGADSLSCTAIVY
jgi:peptidoglycan hydrolase-like protein with peptidoglycan-binding domain